MSEDRRLPPQTATSEASALRQTGAAPLNPGDPDQVGPYVPLALLGSGGMGRVYLARPVDDSPGLVAVKVIRPEYAEDASFRRRFEREALVHDRLRTPHTPRLCGTGFRDELLWMATEYLPGLDLAEAVREDGALETATVWRLTAQLGQALADLAAAGIVHRDLKPSNVLLTVRGAHVIDFGISKAVDASSITGTGNRVGTPAYMSPEHLRTGLSDTASDVFSLAGTLIYAAAGRAPFGDGTGVDVMHRVAFEEPDPKLLGEIGAADAALGSLLSACLAKEPELRPTPQDLVDAAAPHAGPPGWAEPLGDRVLARQRAYETLQRLPAERRARPRPAGEPQRSVPTPPAPESRPAPPGFGPAAVTAGSSALTTVTPPERPRPTGGRAWAGRNRVPAVAAVITLCAVAAGAFVFARQDTPATAHGPDAGATASANSVPGDAAASSMPGAPQGASPDGSPGRTADSAAHTDGNASSPVASASADGGPTNDPAAPATEPSAPADTPASPSPEPPEPATPPWISDCTHYSGSGRTSQGDSGKRVLQVQCMLTNRGYGVGGSGVDGEFGPETDAAVRSFQSDRRLDVDGIVGHDTWAALRSTE
ncbi:protein kinase [Streptomyces sp. AC555_RSS877]|uniref:protein kinase domain-containing protein n=1 Tax=Streptomyces sp. AC555_RSS877 TaxID=2823688 RepID=UPI0027E4AA7B|nr:protein kinase [Streptomyces sp. AC555_RSS877]